MADKACSECGAGFECGINTSQSCWCSHFPAIMSLSDSKDCRCPTCLRAAVKDKIDDYLQQNPLPATIPEQYKNKQLIEYIDYYIENGKWVFTAWYHCKRGSCCGNSCRHCPYDHVNVSQ